MIQATATKVRASLFHPDRAGNISHVLRARRWAMLVEAFPDLPSMRVLDLGGTWNSWTHAPVKPKAVVTLNLESQPSMLDWVGHVVGDACDLPEEIRRDGWDLVYSNSLIEHVGGPYRRHELADTIRAVAPHHWIQTPARSFFIEPHWLFPGFQFLPLPARAWVSRRWPLGHIRTEGDWNDAVRDALSVDLLTATEMRYLFPDATLIRERVGGLTKSLVATR